MEVSVTSSSDRETAPIETSASQNGADDVKKSSDKITYEKTWTKNTFDRDFKSMLEAVLSLKSDDLTDDEMTLTTKASSALKKSVDTTLQTISVAKTCGEDIDMITKTLLPKLETSCKTVEDIFKMVDAMESLMVQIKYCVTEAESRVSTLCEDESDGSVIANFLTNLLTQASTPTQNKRKNKGPLPIFKTKDHPGVFRRIEDSSKKKNETTQQGK